MIDSDWFIIHLKNGEQIRTFDFASSPKRRGLPGSVGWIVDSLNEDLAERAKDLPSEE